MLDKIKGCIVGGAVGDALGYPVEFMGYGSIVSRFGPKGITRYALDGNGVAEFSDDTQMTLFTATGLLAAGSALNLEGVEDEDIWVHHVARHYIDWYWTQNYGSKGKEHDSWLYEVPELHSLRAPGTTCLGSLRNLVHGVHKRNNSKGCGGVMRVAPVALCADLRESMGSDFLSSLGAAVADITHNHPLGYLPAGLLVMILDRILTCGGAVDLKELVVSSVLDMGRQQSQDYASLADLMMRAVELSESDRPDEECIRSLGEGWVGDEALAIAVYCALRHPDSFEDAVVAAVNHSGDSDSTGAVCGNIMGLVHGYDAIPAHFREHLELLPLLEEVAVDLYTGSGRTANPEAWKKKYLEGHRA